MQINQPIFLQRLKETMIDKGVKPAELSRRTGIGLSSISQYMSGRYMPKGNRIADMARALNVNPAWLAGYDEPMQVGQSPATYTPTPDEAKATNAKFAELVKTRRRALHLTIAEIANLAKIDASRYEQFENGEYLMPELCIVERVAQALSAFPQALFDWRTENLPMLAGIDEARNAWLSLNAENRAEAIRYMQYMKYNQDQEELRKKAQ